MSLNEALHQYLDKTLLAYAEAVAEKFGLETDDVLAVWNNGKPPVKKTKPACDLTTVDMDDLSMERLSKCNKDELKALCKAKGCKCTGKKEELINRLLGNDETPVPSVPVKKPVKNAGKAPRASAVIQKLTASVISVPLRYNNFRNLEHPETRLVFDKQTQFAIGRQEDDGTVADLTDEDIEKCKQYKFKYEVPANLEKKGDLNQVKVAELDDDEVEIIVSDDEVAEEGDEEGEEEELEEEDA